MKKNDYLFGVLIRGLIGAFIGIIAGFALGLLIWILQYMLHEVTTMDLGKGDYSRGYSAPIESIATLGMCFGAIIGSVFGSIAGLKDKKKFY